MQEGFCDFQLLLVVWSFLDEQDMAIICEAVRELDDSKLRDYPFMLKAYVGLE